VSEVLVVDNASTDLSLELCAQHFPEEPKLRIIRSAVNLGFAAACNIGIAQARESYVLFLNPDCILDPGSLQRMVQVLKVNPDAGIVGGLLINPDGTEQPGGRRAVPTPWRSFVRAFGLYRFAGYWPRLFFDFHLHKQALPDHPVEVEAISGALMLARREAIEDVGLWDEGYFLHCEDFDWCMRFRQKGWKILFVPDAPVVHHKGICSRSRPIFVEWHKHKGMLRFYRKFFRHRYPGAVMWLVALGIWLRFGAVAIRYATRQVGGLLVAKQK
jgi:GT2 family glycosyltransferase